MVLAVLKAEQQLSVLASGKHKRVGGERITASSRSAPVFHLEALK